jgi:imidazolonepropionase-like amidohydrolase
LTRPLARAKKQSGPAHGEHKMVEVNNGHSARLLLLVSLLAVGARAEPPEGDRIAIRAGTLLTVTTNPIPDGTILCEGGEIRAVGREVVVPDGVRVISAKEKFVLPGFVDAASALYLSAEEAAVSGGAAEWNIVDALDPFLERWEEVLQQGVTAVYVAPPGRSGFAGRAAVLSLNGAKVPGKLVLKADAAVRASIGLSADNRSSSLARLDDYAGLRETLIATQAYLQRQRRYQQDLAAYEKQKTQNEKKDGDEAKKDTKKLTRPDKPRSNPTHEVLGRVLAKEIPLEIEAHRADDILNALRLADEFEFSLILAGCTEGYLVADEIARRNVPVVVMPVSTAFAPMPRLEYRRHRPENAAILAGRGIQTALGVAGRGGLSSKFVPLAAALAVANGMDRDAALRAVTLTPAQIFGVADRIGSLEAGKRADLVIMTGHPLDASAKVDMVLIGGRIVYQRGATP